uniref:G domain-containing protein n=1 Tax=Erpetoichthys calabaricus TaxID=27687 RepID=A0A8C4SXB9_ERPCA
MARISQRLDGESEKELFGFFKAHVKFSLLHKSSVHGFSLSKIQEKCAMEGHIMLVVYNGRGIFMGAYSSKGLVESSCNQCDFYFRYYVTKLQKSLMNKVSCQANCMTFDDVFKIKEISDNKQNISVSFSKINCTIDELEVYRVEDLGPLLHSAWRELPWTTQKREELRDAIVSFKPPTDLVTQTRVLLVGPVGAGKSSFISSVCSVLQGTVTCQTMAGMAGQSFTTKYRTYPVFDGKGTKRLPFILCDTMGLEGSSDEAGIHVDDIISVINGHVPDMYEFNPKAPINYRSKCYRENPCLADKVHCIVYVVEASKLSLISEVLLKKFKFIQSNVNNKGIPQLVMVTKIDEACMEVRNDLTKVYQSSYIYEKVTELAKVLGVPLSAISLVKNYAVDFELNLNMDVLILTALQQMLRAVDGCLDEMMQRSLTQEGSS